MAILPTIKPSGNQIINLNNVKLDDKTIFKA